jgi:hypothetical protein
MAERERGRVIEQDTVLRNFNDEELVRAIQSDLNATDLERHLATRLAHHYDRRRQTLCMRCGGHDE